MDTVSSWLDPYIDAIGHFVVSQVVLAPLLLLFIEEMGVPLFIPGDAILAYVGYRLGGDGAGAVWFAFLVAMIAVLCGATILFRLSQCYGQFIIQRLGKFLFIKPRHIAKSEAMFAKYGGLAIVFGRHIPGLRIPLTIIAGTSGMSYQKFITATFLSTALWVPFYLEAGRRYGQDVVHFFRDGTRASVGVALVIGIAVLVLRLRGLRARDRLRVPDEQNSTTR
jgi:membrane protein DedA with SNARE-associated domain